MGQRRNWGPPETRRTDKQREAYGRETVIVSQLLSNREFLCLLESPPTRYRNGTCSLHLISAKDSTATLGLSHYLVLNSTLLNRTPTLGLPHHLALNTSLLFYKPHLPPLGGLACFSFRYGNMSIIVWVHDLDAETSVGFAAELSPEEPPTDEDDKSLLLQLLELQILWGMAAHNYWWGESYGEEHPSGAINLSAMGVWVGQTFALHVSLRSIAPTKCALALILAACHLLQKGAAEALMAWPTFTCLCPCICSNLHSSLAVQCLPI